MSGDDWPVTAEGVCRRVARFFDEQSGGQIRSLEAWLVAHGAEAFEQVALPAGEEIGEPQECFRNALLLALKRDWTYCEGILVDAAIPIPIHHAWVVDPAGDAVDPTLDDPDRDLTYYGIRIPREVLCDIVIASRTYGVLDKREGMAALADLHPIDAINEQEDE